MKMIELLPLFLLQLGCAEMDESVGYVHRPYVVQMVVTNHTATVRTVAKGMSVCACLTSKSVARMGETPVPPSGTIPFELVLNLTGMVVRSPRDGRKDEIVTDETDRTREVMCAADGRRRYPHCCASTCPNYIIPHDINCCGYVMRRDIISNIEQSHAGIGFRKEGVG